MREYGTMFISKRAKVVSEKPAFKEKDISESGGIIYRYSPESIKARWHEKCEKLKRLEKNIDKVRKQYEEDLSSDDFRTRAEAAVVGIIDDTAQRIGNEESVREHGTYGVSTLKVKHLTFSGNKTIFKFIGKDQVKQNTETSNSKITKVLKELVKGKKNDDFVFEIDGVKIWDRSINRYLEKFDISAKDLRGFQANRIMKEKLKTKDFKEALEETAKEVGHEAATLKNQYLDPHLVEKYIKKASINVFAEELPLGKAVDINKNVGNVSSKADLKSIDLLRAWRIIAPFLPTGSTLTSTYRSDFSQAKTIIEFWRSVKWDKSAPKLYEGFFHKNFSKQLNVSVDELNALYSKSTKHWLSKKDIARINSLANFMASYKPHGLRGEPKIGLSIALIGKSEHRFGTALDISGAPLKEIEKAIQYINNKMPGSLQLSKKPYLEPANNAVHLEFSGTAQMPDINMFVNMLQEFYSSKKSKPTSTKTCISKRAKLTPEDSAWLEKIRPTVLIQRDKLLQIDKYKDLGIGKNVKLNQLLLDAWKTLLPFLPAGARMTSGARTPEDQKRILNKYWNIAGLTTDHPSYGNYYAMSKELVNRNYIVGPPSTNYPYAHLHGTAMDISGADLNEIANTIKFVSLHPDLPVKFINMIIERKNNDVHVGIVDAKYNPDAISKVLKETRKLATITNIENKTAEFVSDPEIHSPELEKDKSNPHGIGTDMGFGKDDLMGDWFEKSPMFRDRTDIPDYEIHDVNESEARNMAKEEPDKFFYHGLHKTFPDLESEAIKNMIENNAKFFFVFKYHERPEDIFKQMIEHAAELLSIQDVRAFFYYHLHQHFPELGRGAIIQLIDLDPGSFFDFGLEKDYPDYTESANNARNIINPQRTQVEVHASANPIITKRDIERIYELEYKLSRLRTKGYAGHRLEHMEKELSDLLYIGILALQEAFKKRLKIWDWDFQGDLKNVREDNPDVPEEDIYNNMVNKYYNNNRVYLRLKQANDKLLKGSTGNLKNDMVLFQEGLHTMHYISSMAEYLPGNEEMEIDDRFLKELSSGDKYIARWDKDISSIAVEDKNNIHKLSIRYDDNIIKQQTFPREVYDILNTFSDVIQSKDDMLSGEIALSKEPNIELRWHFINNADVSQYSPSRYQAYAYLREETGPNMNESQTVFDMSGNDAVELVKKMRDHLNGPSFQKGLLDDFVSYYKNEMGQDLDIKSLNVEDIIEISKVAEEEHTKSVIEDLMKSNVPEDIKEVFEEQSADDKIKIQLDADEKRLFDLLKEVKAYYKLPVELRVVGGWVRDKTLEQIRKK